MEKLKDIHKFRNITYSNLYFGDCDLLKVYFNISFIFGDNEWSSFNQLEFVIGYRDKVYD
jgi:hypothetical protein